MLALHFYNLSQLHMFEIAYLRNMSTINYTRIMKFNIWIGRNNASCQSRIHTLKYTFWWIIVQLKCTKLKSKIDWTSLIIKMTEFLTKSKNYKNFVDNVTSGATCCQKTIKRPEKFCICIQRSRFKIKSKTLLVGTFIDNYVCSQIEHTQPSLCIVIILLALILYNFIQH